MYERKAAELRSKSFFKPVVNGWKKLPEKVVEVGSVDKFKGRLDIARLYVFGEIVCAFWG